jgi:hypothetical protein
MTAAVTALVGEIIDVTALGETVLAALVAGTVVTLTFSVGIYGATRFADLRRDGRPIEAAFAMLLAAVALLISAGAVVIGLIVMIS